MTAPGIGRRVAWVGADGALGTALAPALGAHPVSLRCPTLEDDAPMPELARFDVVIHAAGPRVHPGLGWGDYLREHVGTTAKVARSMAAGAHMVLVSSAAVYGSGRVGTVTSATAPRPDSFPVPPYAWAKLVAEDTARAHAAERGFALTILRPSIIYGPGAGGVLITLRDLARRGVRVELRPPGTRQHLLSMALFRRILEALVVAGPPARPALHVVADPFVVPTVDVNRAYARAAPRATRVPVPIGAVAGALRSWQRTVRREVPGPVAVAAMLALDNVYDARPVLDELGIDPGPYGRPSFDAFLAGSV